MLCKGRFLGPLPLNWGQHDIHNIPLTLTLRQAAQMSQDRRVLGLTTHFQRLSVIQSLAAGNPVPHNHVNYAFRALRSSGYFSRSASAIHNLRTTGLLLNNCIDGIDVNNVGFETDSLIIHVCNERRESKNVKELSYNSLLDHSPNYRTLKDIINDAYQVVGLDPPESVSIISASTLQEE